MGLFSKDTKHLFAHFEKYTIERKFLNIHLISKNKIQFISRNESEDDERNTLQYNYSIKNNEVRFRICKEIFKTDKKFEERYNSFASYLYTGERYEGKQIKKEDSYIGLPKTQAGEYPYTILIIDSFIPNKTNYKKNFSLVEYLTLENLRSGWRKQVERDFNIVSDKIIDLTLKQIK